MILLGKYSIWGGGGAYTGASQGGPGPLRPNILLAGHQELPGICPYKRASVRDGTCLYKLVGVREPGISGPIRPGGLAPRCPAICRYKRAGIQAGICPYKRGGVSAVKELGILGLSRLGGLAQGAPGFTLTNGPASGPRLADTNGPALRRSLRVEYRGRSGLAVCQEKNSGPWERDANVVSKLMNPYPCVHRFYG